MPASKGIDWFIEKFTKFNHWLMIIPMLTLLGIMLVDGLNIITIRFFGVRATPVQKELIEEMLIIMGYVALAYITLAPGTGHIKTEMLKERMPPKLRFAAEIIVSFTCLAVSAYIIYSSSSGLAYTITHHSAKEGLVMIPLAPFYMVIPVSFALFFLGCLLLLIRNISLYLKPDNQKGQETTTTRVDAEIV